MPLSLKQLGHEPRVGSTIVFVRDVHPGQRSEFCL